MSGVVVGSRLQQLEDLQRQIAIAIEAERRHPTRNAGHVRPRPGQAPQPLARTALGEVVRVPLVAIPHKTMRDWANANGFPQKPTGPVTADAVRAFIEAHQ